MGNFGSTQQKIGELSSSFSYYSSYVYASFIILIGLIIARKAFIPLQCTTTEEKKNENCGKKNKKFLFFGLVLIVIAFGMVFISKKYRDFAYKSSTFAKVNAIGEELRLVMPSN